ncbi:MAG: hypothetical protein NVS9B12_11130 [Vulcanimicrobiaceae bacterium]
MSSRRLFLGAALAGGAGLLLSKEAGAQSTATPTPAPTPSAAPLSAIALATALDMRRYDPKLTDADIKNIATQIDANAKASKRLNPHGSRLSNSDEPVTIVRVRL